MGQPRRGSERRNAWAPDQLEERVSCPDGGTAGIFLFFIAQHHGLQGGSGSKLVPGAGCNASEAPGPTGDLSFQSTFGAALRASPNISGYDPHPVRNLHNTTSSYQNWQLTLTGDGGARIAFLAGDWSTREHAPPPNLGVPGWAERGLSDFPGGPLPWLRDRLAAEAALPPSRRPDALFLVQHQPITCPFYIPDALFCFGVEDKALLESALQEHWLPCAQPPLLHCPGQHQSG